ncbi:MAG: hypothetical protein ACLTSZ_17105 [Lachnospiraceae bacterium]
MNYLRQRLAALLLIAAAGICGQDPKQAWRIFRRDRYKHASPNWHRPRRLRLARRTLQLAGDAWYFGNCIAAIYRGRPRPIGAGGYHAGEPDDVCGRGAGAGSCSEDSSWRCCFYLTEAGKSAASIAQINEQAAKRL